MHNIDILIDKSILSRKSKHRKVNNLNILSPSDEWRIDKV